MPLSSVFMVMLAILTAGTEPGADQGPVIKLPEADQQVIQEMLGNGVVGKAVPAPAISDSAAYFALEPGTRRYRVVSRDNKVQEEVLTRLKRGEDDAAWRLAIGERGISYLRLNEDGGLLRVSQQTTSQGVVSHFSPPEWVLVSGMKPGETKKTEIAVKVYDLSDPDALAHSGSLNLTYAYVGAYEVKVPAGNYTGVLITAHYHGKIGPATVDDKQYIFYAKGVGKIASIELENISALFVYHDNTKTGKLLLEHPSASGDRP